MELNTSYSLFALQNGSPDGGIFFGGLILLPIGFFGLVLTVIAANMYTKLKVDNFNSIWAIIPTITSALIIATLLRILLITPPLEIELVATTSTLLFPLGISTQERNWTPFVLISTVLLVAFYSFTHVFPNTFDEVIPLTAGTGLVFFFVGYKFHK